MAKDTTLDSIVEAQYRNLALAAEIIAAKRRTENASPLRKLDLKEPVATRSGTGSLAAKFDPKVVLKSPTRHSNLSASGRPFRSWLATVTIDTRPSVDTKPQWQLDLIARKAQIDRLLWEERLCQMQPGLLVVFSQCSSEQRRANYEEVLFEDGLFEKYATGILPVVKFPNSQFPVSKMPPAPSPRRTAVPASSYRKPAFVFYDLYLGRRPSECRDWPVWIKTFDMTEARVVELPQHTQQQGKRTATHGEKDRRPPETDWIGGYAGGL